VIPLYVMVIAIAAARALGWLGWAALDDWAEATRGGLAVMFVFTAASHFTRTRQDLIRIVPPQLPNPALLVTLTGVAEAVGAVGLVTPGWSRVAGAGLILLLLAMFPANIRAAQAKLTIAGRPAPPLPFRAALQVFWIGLIGWSALH